MTNQILFTKEGVNTAFDSCFIDISRAGTVMQVSGIANRCQYYQTEGIGNNLILNRVTFTGKNILGLKNRLTLIKKPMNVTVANSQFIDA